VDFLKKYEQYSNLITIKDLPLILRIDGRSFSNYTKKLKLEKPFDSRLRDIFIEVSKDLLKEFSTKYIYTFSDEINILLETVPFNGRIEKIDSVFASFVAGSFMKHLFMNADYFEVDLSELDNVSFDCRIITTANHIKDYFKWRQDEAWRNCLNSYAQFILNKTYDSDVTAQKLYKLNKNQVHDLLFQNGINIAHVPTWQKRGFAVYKKEYEIKGINPKTNETVISYRTKPYIDLELNLFK